MEYPVERSGPVDDLEVVRRIDGGAPNCGPHVVWEAYSHEVSSCGYWPGPPGEEGVFYAHAQGARR